MKSIFGEPWFTWHAMAGIRSELHGHDGAGEHERALLAQMFLRLLRDPQADSDTAEAARFFSFCMLHRGQSKSQIFQDLWVLSMSGEKRDGFFVEFGACDGKSLSNTLLLEQSYGWTGILAEPDPIWHDRLKANRKCQISELCVYHTSGEKISFSSVPSFPELSRITEVVPSDVHEGNGNRSNPTELMVDTISLADLLRRYEAPKVIDYLSIDTEGSEFDILQAFDFDAYRFNYITVEHAGETTKRENIKTLLEGNGYRRWWPELSQWDDWYVGPGALQP